MSEMRIYYVRLGGGANVRDGLFVADSKEVLFDNMLELMDDPHEALYAEVSWTSIKRKSFGVMFSVDGAREMSSIGERYLLEEMSIQPCNLAHSLGYLIREPSADGQTQLQRGRDFYFNTENALQFRVKQLSKELGRDLWG